MYGLYFLRTVHQKSSILKMRYHLLNFIPLQLLKRQSKKGFQSQEHHRSILNQNLKIQFGLILSMA